MKTFFPALLIWVLAAAVACAKTQLTPEMQRIVDEQKAVIAKWAANPVIVHAVEAQNAEGPIPGMDNKKWQSLESTDQIIQRFLHNPAGKWLAKKLKANNGLLTEAFLNARNGEKVAFAAKPVSYLDAGTAKFNVAIKNKTWQGKPEFNRATKTDEIQISTPVRDKDGNPIGVLIVGISMGKLEGK